MCVTEKTLKTKELMYGVLEILKPDEQLKVSVCLFVCLFFYNDKNYIT